MQIKKNQGHRGHIKVKCELNQALVNQALVLLDLSTAFEFDTSLSSCPAGMVFLEQL